MKRYKNVYLKFQFGRRTKGGQGQQKINPTGEMKDHRISTSKRTKQKGNSKRVGVNIIQNNKIQLHCHNK